MHHRVLPVGVGKTRFISDFGSDFAVDEFIKMDLYLHYPWRSLFNFRSNLDYSTPHEPIWHSNLVQDVVDNNYYTCHNLRYTLYCAHLGTSHPGRRTLESAPPSTEVGSYYLRGCSLPVRM